MKTILSSACIILLFVSPLAAETYTFVTFEFPPFEYSDTRTNEVHGAAVDCVRSVMKKLGHSVDIRLLAWERSLRMTRDGSADAIFTVYRNPEREAFLDYSGEILIPQITCLYKRRGDSFSYNGDPLSLKGRMIGTVSTISYGISFDKARPQLSILSSYSLESNLRMLARGNLDLLISERMVCDYTIQKLGLRNSVVRIDQEMGRIPSYIAFSKKKNLLKLRDRFDSELSALKKSGEYQNIMRRHGFAD